MIGVEETWLQTRRRQWLQEQAHFTTANHWLRRMQLKQPVSWLDVGASCGRIAHDAGYGRLG